MICRFSCTGIIVEQWQTTKEKLSFLEPNPNPPENIKLLHGLSGICAKNSAQNYAQPDRIGA